MISTGDQLSVGVADLAVAQLGEPLIVSPMAWMLRGRARSPHYVHESDRVLLDDTAALAAARECPVSEMPSLEPGGPREYIYFDPARTRVGIVTCGGLCPGLNNVIRGLVLGLSENYGVTDILGFRNGYQGLAGDCEPLHLTPALVADIHNQGGTILGTSRGGQDTAAVVATLARLGISVLFVVGGDGTLRAAQEIADAASERGIVLSVIGVPKTIDNDVPYMDHSFGFQTAFARAAESIRAAHTEASSTPHGVGLVKLMGRHSGFIACYAALANHDADCVLIPEVPVNLDGPGGFLPWLRGRVRQRGHAVIVVAEGAGQDLLAQAGDHDASGNIRLADVGALLRERIIGDFAAAGIPLSLRYVDPGYAIRGVTANAYDAVFCLRLAQAAVHAAMAGRTAMVVGRWHGRFVHLPISLATGSRNLVDPDGDLWMSVLETTGQPPRFGYTSGLQISGAMAIRRTWRVIVPIPVRDVAAAAGAILVLSAVASVVGTVIVPRRTGSRLTSLVASAVNGLFRLMTRPVISYRRRDRILASQAAVMLLGQLALWLGAFYLGYTLLIWPVTAGIGSAFSSVGPALWTFGSPDSHGFFETAALDTAAMAGLITVTLQIAYLPHLYAAFNRRENEIALLNSRGGTPSWGPELLARTHYALGSGQSALDTLPEFYSQWERWAADVAESHVTYSPLVWFRSPTHEASWVTSLLAVLDSAALYLSLCPSAAPAVPTRLCLRSGLVCFGEVACSIGIGVPAEPELDAGISLSYDEFLDAVIRLREVDFPMEREPEAAWPHFAGWRVNYEQAAYALAEAVDAVPALWSGPRRHPATSIPPLRPMPGIPA